MKKIIIIGGSGFIGTKLTEALLSRGYRVHVIDLAPIRISHEHLTFTKRNIAEEGLPDEYMDEVWGAINLAGVSIGKRWNKKYKQLIYDSRIGTTKALHLAVEKHKPSVVVQASAVGFYGDRGDTLLDESSPNGTDFLAKVCSDWEDALYTENVRIVYIRTAHVLGGGGLLATLEPIFKKGLGGYFSSGRQYMPWVHIEDIVRMYIFALEENIFGPCNTAAGEPVTQKELFKAYAKSISISWIWRIPRFIATLVLGEFGKSLCFSQRVNTANAFTRNGFKYKYSSLKEVFELH